MGGRILKIKSIKIESNDQDNGLKDIHMNRLENYDLVILVGKNGSGKTRIFNKVKKILKQKPTKQQLESQRTRNLEELRKWKKIETDILYDKYQFFEVVPKNLKLTNPNNISINASKSYIQNMPKDGIENIANASLCLINEVANKYIHATSEHTKGYTQNLKDQFKKNYHDLNKIIASLLGVELEIGPQGISLFNHPLNTNEVKLSEGQISLIQYAVQLYELKNHFINRLIFLDEPENNLHPEAAIKIIKSIKALMKDSQLWIATHSISIISFFYSDASIWFVEDGYVKFSGKTPEKVFTSLLGDKERINKLHSFLDKPSKYALEQFSYECLMPPKVITTNSDDPQIDLVRTELQKQYANEPLKILDFGSGKGRILSCIAENLNDNQFSQLIDYYAFDPSEEDKEYCLKVINNIYSNEAITTERYYNNIEKLIKDHKQNFFDMILLCNVFHEIEPNKWLDTFNNLTQIMDDNSELLIIEDHVIPYGEHAHSHGFLVYDTNEFKALFNQTEVKCKIHKRNDRIKAHYVTKKMLENVNQDSLRKSLIALKNNSKKQIKDIREHSAIDSSFSKGKQMAFWAFQYINSESALDEFDRG